MIGSKTAPLPPTLSCFKCSKCLKRKGFKRRSRSSGDFPEYIYPISRLDIVVEDSGKQHFVAVDSKSSLKSFSNPFYKDLHETQSFDELFRSNKKTIHTYQTILMKAIKSRIDALLALDTKLIQRSPDTMDLLMDTFASVLESIPIVGKAASVIRHIGSHVYDKRVETLWRNCLRNVKISSLSTEDISETISKAWTSYHSSRIIDALEIFKKSNSPEKIIDIVSDSSAELAKTILSISGKYTIAENFNNFIISQLLHQYTISDITLKVDILKAESQFSLFNSTQFISQMDPTISGKHY